METLEEIRVRLDRVGVQLLKEEALEEPPKIPNYARSLEGTTSEGITQDEEENEGVNSNSTDRSLQNSSISGQNFLALPSPENSELNNHNGEEMRRLLEKKELMMGPRPNGRLGHAHLLLRLVWDGRYEEVHKSEDDAFLHFFYSKCVKHAVGRKKWNVHHDELLLDRFVTYSDEAFAMLCIENYIGKLMDELRFPEMDKKSTWRTLYTEGRKRDRFSQKGQIFLLHNAYWMGLAIIT